MNVSGWETDGEHLLDGVRGRELASLVRKRALVILGLSGVAITQPVLEVFGNNAEFFVAGSYTTAQIVAFALVVALVPPLVGIAVTTVGLAVDRRVGTAVFIAVTGLLAGAFALALLRTLDVDEVKLVVVLAIGFASAAVYLVWRAKAAQLFLSYLAAANLVFVGSFLFTSGTSELVIGDGSAGDIGEVTVPDLPGPLVVVILDEFPVGTILRGDGTINGTRYPGFAELAEVSTWFRNASSTENETQRAVPTILTGTVVETDSLPTYADHPRNLFTLLGRRLPLQRFEAVTNMCPPDVCEPPPRRPLSQALSDASIVYGHRILPGSLREDLPVIDNSWGDFGGDANGGVGGASPTSEDLMVERLAAVTDEEQGPLGQAAMMSKQIEAIDGDPRVNYLHLLLPHDPWTLSPTGVSSTYMTDWGAFQREDADTPGHEFRARLHYQLHSMQVGVVDALVGQLVDRLRSMPSWDDTTLIVTSDHGINFTPPDLGRKAITGHNREEVLRVPLFIKVPGQTTGDRRDDAALTIDILPTIVDLLDVTVDDGWRFDGHSLYDRSEAHTQPIASADVDDVIAIAERHAAAFPHGDDWLGLAAVGDDGDLVGRRVAQLTTGGRSDYDATLDAESMLDDLPTDGGAMPFVLTGTVSDRSGERPPPELLVAVNGRLAGVVGGYRPSDGGWEFIGYVADLYRQGANAVELYEVERRGRSVTLHPLS